MVKDSGGKRLTWANSISQMMMMMMIMAPMRLFDFHLKPFNRSCPYCDMWWLASRVCGQVFSSFSQMQTDFKEKCFVFFKFSFKLKWCLHGLHFHDLNSYEALFAFKYINQLTELAAPFQEDFGCFGPWFFSAPSIHWAVINTSFVLPWHRLKTSFKLNNSMKICNYQIMWTNWKAFFVLYFHP